MRRFYLSGVALFLASSLVGCGGSVNDETVMAPPMGPVDIPPGAENVPPPPVITDSSAYAEANVDTSGDPKTKSKKK